MGKSEHKMVIHLGVAGLASLPIFGQLFGMQVMVKEDRRKLELTKILH